MTTVLSKAQILSRLEAGDIFEPTTWDESNLRPASYDIRIAADVLRIPGEQAYLHGHIRNEPIILRPGDVAFVTSAEEFRLALDLSGNIGIRFSFVAYGLLVHTGLIIDPGYGRDLELESNGRKRLHFLIINLSDQDRSIKPGDNIVSVQFLQLDEASDQRHTPPDTLEVDYLERNEQLGLSLITQIGELRASIPNLDRRVEQVEHSSRELILFGVFIVAAAFLGVVLTELIGFISSPEHEKNVSHLLEDNHLSTTWLVLIALTLFIGLPLACWLLMRGARALVVGAYGPIRSTAKALARGLHRFFRWLAQDLSLRRDGLKLLKMLGAWVFRQVSSKSS